MESSAGEHAADDDQQESVERLYREALFLAELKTAEFREQQKLAAEALRKLAAEFHEDGGLAIARARDLCQEAMKRELEGEAGAVLAHRLLQLALAAEDSTTN
jgi:hypothetical protein